MDIGRPFIKLPYRFDANQLADEVQALPASAWMAHPQRMRGNSAVALISKDGEDNDAFSGCMRQTAHLQNCAYLTQVLASFDEVLGRSRLMRLAAGSEVALHVDFNYHWYSRVRVHIPIITNPQVIFYCADQNVHMQAGESWIFNAWRRHRVVNDSDEDRVHLVIDLAGSAKFWRMLRDASAGIQNEIYLPSSTEPPTAIRTETFNAPSVMAPGEVDALVADLVRDFEFNPKNDPALIDKYKTMLVEFSKDWREIWLQHGDAKSAWPLYQKTINSVHAAMESDRRALVTQSNDIGVNPIIVQRILRAALSVQSEG